MIKHSTVNENHSNVHPINITDLSTFCHLTCLSTSISVILSYNSFGDWLIVLDSIK